ncbi:MAG: M56 family metallopeptidase [Planctomycetota bacterium]|jgi:beta-lactamase regulating signal transducer with metallopeptidase domain
MNELPIDQLWRFALAAIPVAAAAAILCRLLPCRPSTRHAVCVTVLGLLITAPFLPVAPSPTLEDVFGTDAVVVADPVADASPAPDPVAVMGAAPVAAPTPSAAHVAAPSRVSPMVSVPFRSPRTVPWPRRDAALPEAGPRHPVVQSTFDFETDVAPSKPSAVVPHQPRPHVAATPETSPGAAARTQPSPAREARSTELATVATWLARLRDVRDAILTLPPIPTSVWGGGAALVIVVLVGRVILFRRLLRTAKAADPATVRLVSEGAASLNLTRAPVTRFVDERISPLVWCGAQPVLILPRGLWDRLDDPGRRAVVLHELAHLRRRDHWVCWLAAIVGCLYWWHPVVWWLRRRIREEADLCCDAWVTTLLPGARRAYATALLETKKYTSVQPSTEFAVGLGVSTVRARRFSRRLTMVMSQQFKPRLTIGGILLTSVLAVGGWLAAPALACPPAKAKSAKVPKAPTVLRLEKTKPATAPTPDASTFERFMRERGGTTDDASLEERLERIEKLMNKLRRNLDEGGVSGIIGDGGHVDAAALGAYLGKQRSLVADAQSAYRAALGAMGSARSGGTVQVAPPGVTVVTTTDCNKQVSRSYKLSPRKLDALTKLMVRQDVPIYVTPHGDRLEVHATPPQHMVFQVFVDMIDGGKGDKKFKVSDGKRQDLVALMIDSDVPTKIRPHDDGIAVVGSDLEQRIFGAFVDMIEGKGPARGAVSFTSPYTATPEIAEAIATARSQMSHAGDHKINQHRSQLDAMRANLRSLERLMRQRNRQAEDLMEQAERIAEEADRIQDEAERLDDECDDMQGQSRLQAVQRLNQLLLGVRQLENQCRYLEAQAHAVESQNESAETEAESVEERMEQIERLIEELMEKREQARAERREQAQMAREARKEARRSAAR